MISIIVPIYKAEDSLCRCIESILNQTFEDFELILVNDGSPDKCGSICDEYASKDSRIVVIHQENQGQAAARNAGLNIAKGEWILFCDSDDSYNRNILSQYLSSINLSQYDVMHCFNFYNVWTNEIQKDIRYPETDIILSDTYNRVKFLSGNFGHEIVGYSIFNKVYSREMIERFNIRFFQRNDLKNQDDWAEDLAFNLQYCMNVKRICVSERPVYLLYKHGSPSEQNDNILCGRINHMMRIFLQLEKTLVYQEKKSTKWFWKIVIWHLRRYFYLDAGANGVEMLRQECEKSPYWGKLLSWICVALENWNEIENHWDATNSNDYRIFLEYLRDGNILAYKIKSYSIWKIKPKIQKLVWRK